MNSHDSESNYNPYSNICSISSRRPKATTTDLNREFCDEEIELVLPELSDIQASGSRNQLIDLSDLTNAHKACTIERSIEFSNKFACDLCRNIFNENEKVHNAFYGRNQNTKACQSTVDICQKLIISLS